MIYTPHTYARTVLHHVQAAMIAAGAPAITRAYVAVGLVAWDACNQLTVGPERVYRSVAFPSEYVDEDACFAGWIAIPTVITLTRCAPSSNARGKPPTASALDDQHGSILNDAAIIWNALQNDLPDTEWERAGLAQQFLGNEGGIIAIETRVTFGLEYETWCPA